MEVPGGRGNKANTAGAEEDLAAVWKPQGLRLFTEFPTRLHFDIGISPKKLRFMISPSLTLWFPRWLTAWLRAWQWAVPPTQRKLSQNGLVKLAAERLDVRGLRLEIYGANPGSGYLVTGPNFPLSNKTG